MGSWQQGIWGILSQDIRGSRTPLGATECPEAPKCSWQHHALVQGITPTRAASRSPVLALEAEYPLWGGAPAAQAAQSAQDQAPAGANWGVAGGAQHQLNCPKFCCLRVKLLLSGCRGTHLLLNNRLAAAPGCVEVQAGGCHLPALLAWAVGGT